MSKKITFGKIDIQLPSETLTVFEIFEDLATLFETDYQSEAVARLKKELNKIPALKPKPTIDYEADRTSLTSRSATTIYCVAECINHLAASEEQLTTLEKEQIMTTLKTWKRPKPQRWQIGDVFSIPLMDGTFMFGQVIDTYLTKSSPICLLFELKKSQEKVGDAELAVSQVITVLNIDNEPLNNGTYKVLHHMQCFMSKAQRVNANTSYGGTIMTALGNAYYGLEPWNILYKEDYYDQLLLSNIARPKTAQVLTQEARNAYRNKHAGV
ncbi:Imm26 family immunity protein [Isobaculum melis]|uniref:Immunity protein 26 n=1 Tax=Isobaculum melis TaxID=142588 RepID=A0A1H9TFK4_9LACT|nr:Imm26 family immunity protein [Isobaculum melis]SER96120.1 Immunity protein 26 [Isobaculum melis]